MSYTGPIINTSSGPSSTLSVNKSNNHSNGSTSAGPIDKKDIITSVYSKCGSVKQETINRVRSDVKPLIPDGVEFIVSGSSILANYLDIFTNGKNSFDVGDIDLYFKSVADRNNAMKYMTSVYKCIVWYQSKKAIKIENRDTGSFYDFILRPFKSPSQLISHYDFHIVSAAVGLVDGEYIFANTKGFDEDVRDGIVTINRLDDRGMEGVYSTMKRLFKYNRRGFDIPDETLGTVLDEVAKQTGNGKSTPPSQTFTAMFNNPGPPSVWP